MAKTLAAGALATLAVLAVGAFVAAAPHDDTTTKDTDCRADDCTTWQDHEARIHDACREQRDRQACEQAIADARAWCEDHPDERHCRDCPGMTKEGPSTPSDRPRPSGGGSILDRVPGLP